MFVANAVSKMMAYASFPLEKCSFPGAAVNKKNSRRQFKA
jgi:hypothetical protein